MNIYKEEKGITLISLTLYIVLSMIVLAMLAMLTIYFRKNLNNVNVQTEHEIEFDKLNVQLLKETKIENNKINTDKATSTKIEFTNGNIYEYFADEKAIYLNNNIKIAEHMTLCEFEVDSQGDKQILITHVEIGEKGRKTEYVISTSSLTIGQKVTETTKYKNNDKEAVIPAGFTISGLTKEATIDGGLVIYLIDDKTDEEIAAIDWTSETEITELQKEYDQFVWIPVNDINKMYMCQSEDETKSCRITVENGRAICKTHNSENMAGRLYGTDIGEEFNTRLTTQKYSADNLREPDTLSSHDENTENLSMLTSILGNEGYNSRVELRLSLQKEYNEIVKSVCENKGFWVGRYETSEMTNTNTNSIVKIVAGTTTGINSSSWYRAYAQQKKYAENKNLGSLGSTMIQGAAYDQVMRFMDTTNYSAIATGNVEHNFSNLYGTGTQKSDLAKNIYDLEGNVMVWTTEANSTNSRICRGGYYSTSQSASFRANNEPQNGIAYVGSIMQMYIK